VSQPSPGIAAARRSSSASSDSRARAIRGGSAGSATADAHVAPNGAAARLRQVHLPEGLEALLRLAGAAQRVRGVGGRVRTLRERGGRQREKKDERARRGG
jgi:hypothetical protein